MSDASQWQAPGPVTPGPTPPAAPPYPAPPAGAPPFGPPTVGGPDPTGASPPAGEGTFGGPPSEPPARGRSKGAVIAVVVGLLVIGAAAVFAFTRKDGESAGGAATPEAAGLAVLDALDHDDPLGLIDLLLPGERDTLRDPAVELFDELRRLEVLADDASLDDVQGFDITIANPEVTVDETNVDDIVGLRLGGSIAASVSGEDLPLGDLIIDNVDDFDPSEADVTEPATEFELPLAAVEKDGRWYVSAFYSIAEAARQSGLGGEIPATGLEPTGGDSPEDAFDAFLGGLEDLDLEAIIASLNPNEFEALQRYAPLFLADAQRELDDADVSVSLDEADYTTSGEGDTRSITVSYLSGSITAEGETASFTWEGGCLQAELPDQEPFNSCEAVDATAGEVPDEFQEIIDTVSATFDDYENPGVIVEQVDGTWFLSPMATGSDQILAVLRALDRDELEELGGSISEIFSDVVDDVMSGTPTLDLPTEILEGTDANTADTVVVDEVSEQTAPELTIPELTVPSADPSDDAVDTCYGASTAADASDCFAALIETGEISPSEVPVYLRAPECGMADAFWNGDLYSLPDAEFIALVEAAAPCFQQLVTDKVLTESDLPIEISNPECLEGRNWFNADDDDYLDRVFECAYG